MTNQDDDPMSIVDVPRNDLDAAAAYYRASGQRISREEWGMLLRLQDNPRMFERLSKSWNVIDL